MPQNNDDLLKFSKLISFKKQKCVVSYSAYLWHIIIPHKNTIDSVLEDENTKLVKKTVMAFMGFKKTENKCIKW